MEKFSVAKVAQILDLSTSTIKRWYKWYENPDYQKPPELKLPSYTLDNRKTMLFEQKDIAKLQQFHEDLQGKYKGGIQCLLAMGKIRNKTVREDEKNGGER